MPGASAVPQPVLRVGQVIAFCNTVFEGLEFAVEGEVANYSLSRGKFVFFDLKDETEDTRLGCFMMAFQLSMPLEDGMRVVVYAKPNLYAKSGQFRLTVRRVEAKGEGTVKRAFELLKGKLEQEGLFASGRKRPLPRFVQKVGLISSKDAAGFGDFQKVISGRMPGINFFFVNAAVQGTQAEEELCRAFDYLNSHHQLDAIVLIRGGGSPEDLHAFNSEAVARAIVRSKAPVMVGVGHERDVTIADYCADIRAATPSNAAQLLAPTKEEVLEEVWRLSQSGKNRVYMSVASQKDSLVFRIHKLQQLLLRRLDFYQNSLNNSLKTIETLSPTQTLKRGYSITKDARGALLTSVRQAKPGETIITVVQDGSLSSVTS